MLLVHFIGGISCMSVASFSDCVLDTSMPAQDLVAKRCVHFCRGKETWILLSQNRTESFLWCNHITGCLCLGSGLAMLGMLPWWSMCTWQDAVLSLFKFQFFPFHGRCILLEVCVSRRCALFAYFIIMNIMGKHTQWATGLGTIGVQWATGLSAVTHSVVCEDAYKFGLFCWGSDKLTRWPL